MIAEYSLKRIDNYKDKGLRRLEEIANEVEQLLNSFGYPIQCKYLKDDRTFCMIMEPTLASGNGAIPEAGIAAVNERIKEAGFVFISGEK